MNKIYIGKIVSTHGIKGELRILSDFEFKEKAFKINTHLLIDSREYLIKSYRTHKNYDMVTFEGLNNINEVQYLLRSDVYKEEDELNLNDKEVLDSTLITYKVLTSDKRWGIIKEIFYGGPNNKILRIIIKDKEILIPVNSPMIKSINNTKKIVEIELIEGYEI